MIGGRRPLQGRKPADRRVRVERPHSRPSATPDPASWSPSRPPSRRTTPLGPRSLRASSRPSSAARWPTRRRSASACRRSWRSPIFSSDAISSSAYATDEILRVLVLAGRQRRSLISIEVAIAIAVLLTVVVVLVPPGLPRLPAAAARTSSRARTSPQIAGLVAAAALLIDYVMTVAVSTASAMAQVYSVVARPVRHPDRDRPVLAIALITVANLRGLRESGNIFAIPTYLFVGHRAADRSASAWSTSSRARSRRCRDPADVDQAARHGRGARRSCCCSGRSPAASVALTGVEAIANGVPGVQAARSRRTPPTR